MKRGTLIVSSSNLPHICIMQVIAVIAKRSA